MFGYHDETVFLVFDITSPQRKNLQLGFLTVYVIFAIFGYIFPLPLISTTALNTFDTLTIIIIIIIIIILVKLLLKTIIEAKGVKCVDK